MFQHRHHLPLFFSVHSIVLVLHGDEWGEAVIDSIGYPVSAVVTNRIVEWLTLHQLELPCPTTAHTNVSYFASLHNIVNGLHGLLDGSLVVESVKLEDVNVFQLESLQGVVD